MSDIDLGVIDKKKKPLIYWRFWTHALIEVYPDGQWKLVKSWTAPAKDSNHQAKKKKPKIIIDEFTTDGIEKEIL